MADVPQLPARELDQPVPFLICCTPWGEGTRHAMAGGKSILTRVTAPVFTSPWLHPATQVRSDVAESKSQSRPRVDHAEVVAPEVWKGTVWSSVNCFTRAELNRTFSFNRWQLRARLTGALVILYPVLGQHRPDLRLFAEGD